MCLGALSPLLRGRREGGEGAETGRIETICGLLRVVLGATYAVTGRGARGPRLLRAPTKATGVARKDVYCPLSEQAKRNTPKRFSQREKGPVGGTKRERARYRVSERS
jgi:hypothetical protein